MLKIGLFLLLVFVTKISQGVLADSSGCEVPTIRGGSVRQEKFGDWYWTFSGYKRRLTYITVPPGSVVSSGSVLWFYCDEPYSVLGRGTPRIEIRCLTGKWSKDLQCLRAGEVYVPATAKSTLKQFTSTQEPFHSISITTTKSPPPLTTPSPGDVEQTSPPNLDDGKPESGVTPHSSTEPPTEECFCVYTMENNNIVAHADGKRLIDGDKVRNGSTVIFHCKHVGYHRFTGNREITCNGCQPWSSSDLPSCTVPREGDAVIVLGNDVNVLEDGKIELFKGQSVNFTCAAMETAVHPEWRGPNVPGIRIIRDRKDRKDQGDVVYFTHLEMQNATSQKEGTYECSIEGNHKTTIHVIVTDPDLRCPEFPEDDGIIMKYEKERRENSKVSFSCPKKSQELIGKPLLICLRTGNWSDPPPSCSARCYLKDLENLTHVSTSTPSVTISGERPNIICVDGYSAKPDLPICRNGEWDSKNQSLCEESGCEIPRIRGGSVRQEKFGDWIWAFTGYKRNLTYITVPPGSVVSSGNVLWFYCDEPYSVLGRGTRRIEIRCLTGKWSKDLQCVRARCYIKDFKNLSHVSTRTPSVTLSGERPNIICVDGYSAKPDLPICRNGEWNLKYQSLCEESGCEIPRIRGGSVRQEEFGDWYSTFTGYKRSLTFIAVPPGSVVSSGSVFWFYCDEPYSVLGKGKRRLEIRCLTGKWSTDLQCLRAGEVYVPTTAKSTLKQFTSTQEPFHSSSTTTTKSPPILTKPSPGDVEQTSPPNLDDGKPGVTPHSYTDPPTEECFCVYTMDDGNIVAHVEGKRLIDGEKVRKGSTVIFHCKHVAYHRFTGNREITCNDCQPRRSSELLSCTVPREEPKCSVHDLSISVPEDVVPDMTGVNEDFIPPGSAVELKCSDNAIIDGNSKALCGEHGKWEYGSVQCVPGCTLNIDPSSHLLVNPIKDSYRFGEFLILSCPPGKKLSNNVEILMCLNNKWSDSLPDCEESEESDQP